MRLIEAFFGRPEQVVEEAERTPQPAYVQNMRTIDDVINSFVANGQKSKNLLMQDGPVRWGKLYIPTENGFFTINNHGYGYALAIRLTRLNPGIERTLNIVCEKSSRGWTKVSGLPEEFGEDFVLEMPSEGQDIEPGTLPPDVSSFREIREDFWRAEAKPHEFGPKTIKFLTEFTEGVKLAVQEELRQGQGAYTPFL